MKEEILYKYDENFDGKLELEEVFMTVFCKFSNLIFCFMNSPDLKTVASCYFCCLFLIVHLNFNTLQLSSPIYTTSIVRQGINI